MSTARIFDELSSRYELWYQRNWLIAELEVVAVAYLLEHRPVLEVGVGTGFFAKRLGVEYGVDPSIGMLELARDKGLEVVQGVGEKLPFRDGYFGTVLLVVTLCFVDDVDTVLGEVYRVLRRGGEVIACIVPKDSPWGKYYLQKAVGNHPFYSHARFLTTRELTRKLEENGFKLEDTIGILSFGPTEKPRWERPSKNIDGKGFVCVKAVKPG